MCELRSGTGHPSPWVARFFDAIVPGGRVLDIACGTGRHFPLFLSTGRHVTGVDRDITGARQRYPQAPGLQLELIEADLEAPGPVPFQGQRFDGVIVTNYLWRPILPAIVAAVADGGVLIYETFAVGNEAFGRPKNPDFLLEPGELLEAVRGQLTVVAYEHGKLEGPERMVQRICAACGERSLAIRS